MTTQHNDAYQLKIQLQKAEKMKKIYQYCLIFMVLMLIGLMLISKGESWYAWSMQALDFSTPKAMVEKDTFTLKAEPLQEKIPFVGTIEAKASMEVFSFLSGVVTHIYFEDGSRVEKGQKLLVIDAEEDRRAYQLEKAAYLRELQQLKDIKSMPYGFAVNGIRRHLKELKYKLQQSEKELQSSTTLMKQGFVASTEVEQRKDILRGLKVEIKNTKENLKKELKQGGSDYLEIQEMIIAARKISLSAIEKRLASTVIYSSVSGIVMYNPTKKKRSFIDMGTKRTSLKVGSQVKKNQALFTVSDISSYHVKTISDEVQLLKLHVDQEAMIYSNINAKLKLKGNIMSISSQSEGNQGSWRDSRAYYPLQIALNALTEEQREYIRVGMSVNIDILLEGNDKALMIPFSTILMKDDVAWVYRVSSEHEKAQKIKITTGITTADAVEVLKGLSEGDEILLKPFSEEAS